MSSTIANASDSPTRPLAVTFETAEQMTSVSRFTLRKYVKTGRLKVVRVGRRVVIPVSELEKMFSPGAVSNLKARPSKGGTDHESPAVGVRDASEGLPLLSQEQKPR